MMMFNVLIFVMIMAIMTMTLAGAFTLTFLLGGAVRRFTRRAEKRNRKKLKGVENTLIALIILSVTIIECLVAYLSIMYLPVEMGGWR